MRLKTDDFTLVSENIYLLKRGTKKYYSLCLVILDHFTHIKKIVNMNMKERECYFY